MTPRKLLPIVRAIYWAGGIENLSMLLACTPRTIRYWKAKGHVPAAQAKAIERVSGGKFTAEMFADFAPRPKRKKAVTQTDIYPTPADEPRAL